MQCKTVKQPYLVPWLVKIVDILDENKTAFSLLVYLSIAKTRGQVERGGRSKNIRSFRYTRCFWKEITQ